MNLTALINDTQADIDFIGDAMKAAYSRDDQIGLLNAWTDYDAAKAKLKKLVTLRDKILADAEYEVDPAEYRGADYYND